jgi:predicted Ser/Thr protein kinase
VEKERDDRNEERLKTGAESSHPEARSVETSVEPNEERDSESTEDPLEELDAAGRAMLEQVRIGLGLVDGSSDRTLGRFVLQRCLGTGGMGVVHLAHDPQLGREVAIKRIRPRPSVSSKGLRSRLEREGRVLAKLRHPNVVHVYELGEHEGEVFLAMEYVAGQTLSEWQRQPERTRTEILRAYVDAGKGIAAAHAARVIHRDFKPENVLVAHDGRVHVGDFGLAALVRELEAPESEVENRELPSERAQITKTGELVGTLPYMAPERLRGEPGDARADQFSFCVALWEALTRQLPFAGDESVPLRERILTGELKEGGGLPRWLRTTLKRGLSVQPDRRHDDMDGLVILLERGIGRTKRWLLGGAFATVGAIATLGGVVLASMNRPAEVEVPCALDTALAAAPERADWASLRTQLGADADRLRPLENHLHWLAANAEAICLADDAVRIQHWVAWLDDLRRLLDESNPRSTERLLDYIDWLADRRVQGPPPKPLGDAVVQALDASEAAELENDLDRALYEAEVALSSSKELFEKADALLRRGRVKSLQGNYEQAFDDFYEAQQVGDAGMYDDARLRANLLAAEIVLKRLGEVGDAPYFLAEAGANTQPTACGSGRTSCHRGAARRRDRCSVLVAAACVVAAEIGWRSTLPHRPKCRRVRCHCRSSR